VVDLFNVTKLHITKETRIPTFFVYYEEIKRELNRILVYECRCDERLRVISEGSTDLVYSSDTLGCTTPPYLLFIMNRENER
jgi:hypothetical protein